MTQPLVLPQDLLQFARLGIHREQDARRAGARGHQRIVQPQVLGVRERHRFAVRADSFVVGLAKTRARVRRPIGRWWEWSGAVHITAQQKSLIRIEGRDVSSRRQFDDLAGGSRIDIGGVDRGPVELRGPAAPAWPPGSR